MKRGWAVTQKIDLWKNKWLNNQKWILVSKLIYIVYIQWQKYYNLLFTLLLMYNGNYTEYIFDEKAFE